MNPEEQAQPAALPESAGFDPCVGRILWCFDTNSRDPETKRYGVYVKRQIVGETRVSWLVGRPTSAPDSWDIVKLKKKAYPGHYLLSVRECHQRQWMDDHSYRLAEDLRRYQGPNRFAVLSKVAELIGYQEEPPK